MNFGGKAVLRDLTLDIHRGQTLAIIGQSGCGKTVLLKLLIGLLKPTRGKILFDGRGIQDLSEREEINQRLRFGFLFQSGALFDSMTVFENVAFPLREHTRKSTSEMAEIVRQRLSEVGLPKEVEHAMPVELSGGMRKRVGLARALVLDPEIILYDEPTTGLDPIMSEVINDLIQQAHRQHHVTSIVVTHDMKTVRKVADRIVMLYPLSNLEPEETQIVLDGGVEELDACPDPRVRRFVH
jgi:phospholipid/cholesterol/gamma-HCH transport system ATP-binding protein